MLKFVHLLVATHVVTCWASSLQRVYVRFLAESDLQSCVDNSVGFLSPTTPYTLHMIFHQFLTKKYGAAFKPT